MDVTGNNEPEMILIYSTPKPAEVALIKSILNGTDIRYFVSNENLNTLYGSADGFTSMDILVERERAQEAIELLRDLTNPNNTKKNF